MEQSKMDWQQKAEVLAGLAELSIKFREKEWRIGAAEPWYVNQGIDVGGDGLLRGTYGNGHTPQEAIENHWRLLVTELPGGSYLVTRSPTDERRRVRWNGFMWADVPEPNRSTTAAA
jgi:hypothetical protein